MTSRIKTKGQATTRSLTIKLIRVLIAVTAVLTAAFTAAFTAFAAAFVTFFAPFFTAFPTFLPTLLATFFAPFSAFSLILPVTWSEACWETSPILLTPLSAIWHYLLLEKCEKELLLQQALKLNNIPRIKEILCKLAATYCPKSISNCYMAGPPDWAEFFFNKEMRGKAHASPEILLQAGPLLQFPYGKLRGDLCVVRETCQPLPLDKTRSCANRFVQPGGVSRA